MPNLITSAPVSFMPATLTPPQKATFTPPHCSAHYFITLCTHERQCLFGDIIEGQMQLNELGSIVEDEWQHAAQSKPDLICDQWIIMPNHIHGIFTLAESAAELAATVEPSTESIEQPTIVDWIDGFKAAVTERISTRLPIWQPIDDHQLIPHSFAFNTFRQYIRSNPHAWLWDKLHPDSPSDWLDTAAV